MLRIINRIFRKKYLMFLLIVLIVFSVLGEMYHYFILSNVKMMKITLNYPGAEQGLNPDGSRFNISEMATAEIIDEAKSGLEMKDIPYEDIKKRLFITTKFSQNAMDEVVSDIRSGMQGTYVPTTFYVYYSQENKFRKNETYEFLEELALTYRENFNRNHAENNSVLAYKPENYDFENYDYSEIYKILYDKSDEMLSLLRTHQGENRSFRAENNLNFGTVLDELTNFKQVKLEKFNAYIVQNSISKSRPTFINKLAYLTDKNSINFKKLSQASAITKGALDKYDAQITAVAFVPSVDSTSSYYMSRTKTGIDDLAKKSYSDGMDAARVSKKLDEYDNRFQKLSKANDTTEAVKESTEQYLSDLLSNMKELSEKVSALDDEYLEYKAENYISYDLGKKNPVVGVGVIVKFAALGFVMAALIVAYMEFAHDTVHKKTKYIKKAIRVMAKNKR